MLEEALQAAQAIPNAHSRDNNVNSIKQVLERPEEKDERQNVAGMWCSGLG